jgi:hypothetical protein
LGDDHTNGLHYNDCLLYNLGTDNVYNLNKNWSAT